MSMKNEIEGLKQYTHSLKTALDAHRTVKEANRKKITYLQSALAATQTQVNTLRELLEKESLFDEVFMERFYKYAHHQRGCTWDDATQGDVCTCGFRSLVSIFFGIQAARRETKEAAILEEEPKP